MKLSVSSAYALHALAHIARLADQHPDQLVPSHAIAAAEGIPPVFLHRVLRRLAKAGVLRAAKGPGGGYLLARPAKAITLLEVIEAVDGPIRGEVPADFATGQDGLDGRLGELCREAAAVVRARLGRVRLSELVKG
jgi:Rrf2 family protein